MTQDIRSGRRLEIVVPTYNRAECAENMFRTYRAFLDEGYDFCLSVYDSSTDDKTFELAERYACDGIRYVRVPSEVGVDEKTIVALKEAVSPYVMLCGDGSSVNIPVVLGIMDKYPQAQLIALYDNRWRLQKKYYPQFMESSWADKNSFFSDHFWQLILYGGSVCRRELIQNIDKESVIERYGGRNFIYPCSLAKYSVGPYAAASDEILIDNPGKTGSGWINKKEALKVWAENMCYSVDNLEDSLSPQARERILSTMGERTGFMTARGLMVLRTTGNFSLKLMSRYKSSFKRVKGCSSFACYLVALCPVWLCRLTVDGWRSVKYLLKGK